MAALERADGIDRRPGRAAAMKPTDHLATVGLRAYVVRLFEQGACFFTQPVNPKTGRPWQAHRDHAQFHGDRAKGQALRHWLYTVAAARKAA